MRDFLRDANDTILVNGYGPTENTTFTCCHIMDRDTPLEEGAIPIGRPITNTRVYVLDRGLQPVPLHPISTCTR